MGSATRYRQAFLQKHPTCAFCGGDTPATTIEHCPPRAMFQFRGWPEGFEFPACASCNGGTSDDDLVIAWMGRVHRDGDQGNRDNRVEGLMRQMHRQHPTLLQRMFFSAAEARAKNREYGRQPAHGELHQEIAGIRVTEEMHAAVRTLATKLSKGVFYNYVGQIFPHDGCLTMNWFSNADVDDDGNYPILEGMRGLAGVAPALERTGRYLNDQFEFKLSRSPEDELFVLQAKFGGSFGFVVFGSPLPGKLEAMMDRIKERTGRNDVPFAILQSPVISVS